MIEKKKRFIFWLLGTITFMAVIFWQSHTPYQEQDVKPLLSEYIVITPEQLPEWEFYYDGSFVTYQEPYPFIEFFIRKTGHVVEFGLLTFLWGMTLLQTALPKTSAVIIGAILSFLYALSDEWHQSFVPNRTGHLIDVVTFDLLGVLLAVLLMVFVMWISGRRRQSS